MSRSKFLQRLFATVVIVTMFAQQALAATFTVNDNGDASDAVAGDGLCATAGAVCTLRAAIEEANALAGNDTINFDSTRALTPGSAFTVSDDSGATVNGSSSTVSGAGFIVTGNGTTLSDLSISGSAIEGVSVQANDVTVTGSTIGGNTGVGISVDGTSALVTNLTITNNKIGTNAAGTAANSNTGVGILLSGSGVDSAKGIGGIVTITGNTISGNGNHGVSMTGYIGGLLMHSNKIGTNTAGTAALANSGAGVNVQTKAGGVYGSLTIGDGTTAGNYNVISGNTTDGITLACDEAGGGDCDIKVQNNRIGTSADGTADLGNTSEGIANSATVGVVGSVTIGNDGDSVNDSTEGNIISGNQSEGVFLSSDVSGGATTLRVAGNIIGADINGTTQLENGTADTPGGTQMGNSGHGVYLKSTNATAVDIIDNIVGKSKGSNIYVDNLASSTTPVTIQGNYVGIGPDGISTLGAGKVGIYVYMGEVLLGGANDLNTADFSSYLRADIGDGNVIANSTTLGVLLATGVTKGFVYGNIMGLKRSVGNSYDTNAYNADGNLYMGNALYLDEVEVGAVSKDTMSTNSPLYAAGVDANDPAQYRNVISGKAVNHDSGTYSQNYYMINVPNTVASAVIRIVNNYIGTSYDGDDVIGTPADGTSDYDFGILIEDGAEAYIGYTGAGAFDAQAGNVIGGFGDLSSAVLFSSPVANATVKMLGNYIGINAAGTTALAKSGYGVVIPGSSDDYYYIGATDDDGAAPVYGKNVISGNQNGGITLTDFAADTLVRIYANYIGTNAAGTAAVPNGGASALYSGSNIIGAGGIMFFDSTADSNFKIGADSADARNVISGNDGYGILLFASGVEVVGNYIGLSADGVSDLGNTLGTSGPLFITEANLDGSGVAVVDADLTNSFGLVMNSNNNIITNNYIAGNVGSGIAVYHYENGAVGGLVGGGANSTQDWSSGLIQDNVIGLNVSGTAVANDSYGVYVKDADTGQITGLDTAMGGSGTENTVNGGLYMAEDDYSAILTTLYGNNVWYDNPGKTWLGYITGTYHHIENYIAGDLSTRYRPIGTECSDGLDNDSDGDIDLNDAECTSVSINAEAAAVVAACADGTDNDGDGLTDLADPGCDDASDDDETNAVVPAPAQGGGSVIIPRPRPYVIPAIEDYAIFPVCGNEIVEAGEQCDGGIGCSASCTFETIIPKPIVPGLPPETGGTVTLPKPPAPPKDIEKAIGTVGDAIGGTPIPDECRDDSDCANGYACVKKSSTTSDRNICVEVVQNPNFKYVSDKHYERLALSLVLDKGDCSLDEDINGVPDCLDDVYNTGGLSPREAANAVIFRNNQSLIYPAIVNIDNGAKLGSFPMVLIVSRPEHKEVIVKFSNKETGDVFEKTVELDEEGKGGLIFEYPLFDGNYIAEPRVEIPLEPVEEVKPEEEFVEPEIVDEQQLSDVEEEDIVDTDPDKDGDDDTLEHQEPEVETILGDTVDFSVLKNLNLELFNIKLDSENIPSELLKNLKVSAFVELTLDMLEASVPDNAFVAANFIAMSQESAKNWYAKGNVAFEDNGKVVVAVVYKSLITSSVVLSDASQSVQIDPRTGKYLHAFSVRVPDYVVPGKHEVHVYAFDPRKDLMSNVQVLPFVRQ